ncbi:MAG: hypothetical protein LBC75_12780 [Fibromonadaceae bacterium]|jgi:uncharacterized protein (TIGR02145 family)|nr:hypothetical protein [Fibromonadaceae bacterium]
MRKSLTKFAFTASIALALAFTLSCSGGDDGDEGSNSGGSGGRGGNPNIKYGSLTYEGETYKTVKIGELTWMAENLNYAVDGSRCYEDKPANCKKYGSLYDWATAMGIDTIYNGKEWDGSDVKHRGICPPDWHIPSVDEWYALIESVGGGRASIWAKKLKATSDWKDDGNGTDDFGFTALPGGYYNHAFGNFFEVGISGSWHTASKRIAKESERYAAIMWLYYSEVIGGELVGANNANSKRDGLSIRCVQD